MPLHLTRKMMKDKHIGFSRKFIEKAYLEAMNLFEDIFEHDYDKGAKTTLCLGIPGSGKTTVDCHIAEHYIKNCPNDLLFWRSAFSAPLQFTKLSKWHIWIQNGSGIRIYDRVLRKDATELFENNKWITYFEDIPDLFEGVKNRRGEMNALFFKDMHQKNIVEGADCGTLMWFKFIRYLIEGDDWAAVFLDEAQEMAAVGSSEGMWYEIREHSQDLSNARKCLVAVHANCHQTSEIDYRVISNYQMLIQCYGARFYHHSPVNKEALMKLPKPTINNGLYGWISHGNRFGKFVITKVYTLPRGMNYNAKIDPELEEWSIKHGLAKPRSNRRKKSTGKLKGRKHSSWYRDDPELNSETVNVSAKTIAYRLEEPFHETEPSSSQDDN